MLWRVLLTVLLPMIADASSELADNPGHLALLSQAQSRIDELTARLEAAELAAAKLLSVRMPRPVLARRHERLRWLLRIVTAAGGWMEIDDGPHHPLAAFCNDEVECDTFNQAINLDLLKWTHNTDTDVSTVRISPLGTAFILESERIHARAAGWRRMTADELKALPGNGSYPALVRFEAGEWAGHVGLPGEPWEWHEQDLQEALWLPVDEAVGRVPTDAHGIYMASKSVHGPRWRNLRAKGVPIISTWIDEAEIGTTRDWPDLWSRCVIEAASCSVLIVYRDSPDEILKGAWVEAGAALAAGRHVIAVGCDEFTVRHHPRLMLAPDLETALQLAHLLSLQDQNRAKTAPADAAELRRDLARALTSYGGRLNSDFPAGSDVVAWHGSLHDADVSVRIVAENCLRIVSEQGGSAEMATRISERIAALIHSQPVT